MCVDAWKLASTFCLRCPTTNAQSCLVSNVDGNCLGSTFHSWCSTVSKMCHYVSQSSSFKCRHEALWVYILWELRCQSYIENVERTLNCESKCRHETRWVYISREIQGLSYLKHVCAFGTPPPFRLGVSWFPVLHARREFPEAC